MRGSWTGIVVIVCTMLAGCIESRIQPGHLKSTASNVGAEFENDTVYLRIQSEFQLSTDSDPTAKCYRLRNPFKESYHSVVVSISINDVGQLKNVPILALETRADESGQRCVQNFAPVVILPFSSYEKRDIFINYNFHEIFNDRISAEQILDTITDISNSISGLVPVVKTATPIVTTFSSVDKKIADFYQSLQSANTSITDGKIFQIDTSSIGETNLFTIPIYDVAIKNSAELDRRPLGEISVSATTLRSLFEEDGKFSQSDLRGLLSRKVIDQNGTSRTVRDFLNSGDFSMTIELLKTITPLDSRVSFNRVCSVFHNRLKEIGLNIYDRSAVIWAAMMEHPGFGINKDIQMNPCTLEILPVTRELGIPFEEVTVEYPSPSAMGQIVLNLERNLDPNFRIGGGLETASSTPRAVDERSENVRYLLADRVQLVNSIRSQIGIQDQPEASRWRVANDLVSLESIQTSGECNFSEQDGRSTFMRIFGFRKPNGQTVWSEVKMRFRFSTTEEREAGRSPVVISRIEFAPLSIANDRCIQQLNTETDRSDTAI